MTDKHRDSWFKCIACKRQFRLKQTLEEHAKKAHRFADGEQALGQYISKDSPEIPETWLGSCHICNIVFKELPHAHMKSRHPEVYVTCSYRMCRRKFRAKITLDHHVLRDHLKGDQNEIAKYEEHFGTLSKLDIIEKSKSFPCDYCGKNLCRAYVLRLHVLNVHLKEEKNLKRSKCMYKTNKASVLKYHVASHDKDKPFKCELCETKYKAKSSLRDHYNSVHFGGKKDNTKYAYKFCDYSTSDEHYLNTKHQRKHNGERPYSCPVCDLKFTRKFVVKSHCQIKHGYSKQNLMDAGMYS